MQHADAIKNKLENFIGESAARFASNMQEETKNENAEKRRQK